MARKPQESSKIQTLQRSRPSSRLLVRYALIFLAGVLLGWFVFGWWLFPITYTQVYPNELRAEARDEYFQMVAEGYALTGDRIRAAQRLQFWNVDNELPRVINTCILALESSDPEAAEPLRRMAEDLHLTQTTALPQTLGQSPTPAGGDIGRTVLILLGGLLLLSLLWVIYQRFIAPRFGGISRQAPAPAAGRREPQAVVDAVAIDGDFEAIETLDEEPIREDRRPAVETDRYEDEGREQDYRPGIRKTPYEREEERVDEDVAEVIVLPPPSSPPSAGPIPTDVETGEVEDESEKEGYLFEGLIRFDGRPKFNELHRLGEADDYQGEVGLGAGEETRDEQVRTLEVWLFDKADIQTKAVVLMPLEVYENEEQRMRLAAGSSDIAPLQPGEKIRLQTRTFVAEGEIRRVDFGPVIGGVPSIHYAELLLRVRRTDAGEVDESPNHP